MFRPGLIQPLDGIRSRTPMYNRIYVVLRPFVAIAAKLAPDSVNTTRTVGRAMLAVARHGSAERVLESRDIRRLAGAGTRGLRPLGEAPGAAHAAPNEPQLNTDSHRYDP